MLKELRKIPVILYVISETKLRMTWLSDLLQTVGYA
jgi:hypothetical protein